MATNIGALNYATEYSLSLEQAYPYALYFGALYSTPSNGRYRFTSAKTIEMASITTTGRVDGDRDTINGAKRNYSNNWVPRTLANERTWSTLVHPRDVEETGGVTTIANITQTYNEEQKFPEMDAYTISKLYFEWDSVNNNTAIDTALTTENILDVIDDMILGFDNNRVPPAGRLLYVTHETHKLIKNAEQIVRNLDVKTSGTTVNRNVTRLDEVTIVPVPSVLMKTLYDFTEGWEVAPTAKQINMMLVLPSAVITPVTYEFAKLDAPSAGSEGKYVYFEEAHEDVFILPHKDTALSFHVTSDVV